MSKARSALSDAVSRAVLLAAQQGILVVNRAGRIVLVNSKTEELFGYGPDELLGLPVETLLPGLFQEQNQEQIVARLCAPGALPGRVGLELGGRAKDGTKLLLEISLGPVDTHDGFLVCCIIEKTAGRQQSEQALREMEERFRLMVENSHDIITVRDADGKVRYMSPSIHRILGYTQEQMIGSTGFELIHPEERSTVENALKEFWKNPGARDSIQYRARHANGNWISLEVVAYNLLDHPAIRGVVINGRDVSARKQTEAGKELLIAELQEAAANANTLTGLLPICASCKKIRDEGGNWEQIEAYVRDHFQVEFSHGMCPDCAKRWYPDHYEK